MKKLLSLFVLSCAIVANGDSVPMFPNASDTCGTYFEQCFKSIRVGQSLIKFSYFNPSTWFNKTLSPEQVQAVHDAYVWNRGFWRAQFNSKTPYNTEDYPVFDQSHSDAQRCVELLHKSALSQEPVEEYSEQYKENIEGNEGSVKKSILLAIKHSYINDTFEPSQEECISLRTALIFLKPQTMRIQGTHAILERDSQKRIDMIDVFALLKKCSKYSK